MTLQSLNPITLIKNYLAKRRKLKEELSLLVSSGTVRDSGVEIRYGRTRVGKDVRSSYRRGYDS